MDLCDWELVVVVAATLRLHASPTGRRRLRTFLWTFLTAWWDLWRAEVSAFWREEHLRQWQARHTVRGVPIPGTPLWPRQRRHRGRRWFPARPDAAQPWREWPR